MKSLLTTTTLIAGLITPLFATPAMAGQQNCDCYMEGYAAGAMRNRAGMGKIPKRCMIRGVTQFPGQSTWTYQVGHGKGMQIESSVNRKTRARNQKWARDRKAEHERYKRLLCY